VDFLLTVHNYGTHTYLSVIASLARNPRSYLHFTSTRFHGWTWRNVGCETLPGRGFAPMPRGAPMDSSPRSGLCGGAQCSRQTFRLDHLGRNLPPGLAEAHEVLETLH